MQRYQSPGAVNVKVLLAVVIIGAGLVGGAFYLREYRRGAYLDSQLVNAKAAVEAGDWSEAAVCYRRWLSVHKEDQDVLREAAEATLKIRPLTPDAVNLAASYYRTLLRLNPTDSEIAEKCLVLHEHLAQAAEVERIAQQEIERGNKSPRVMLSLARAYAAREKIADAEKILTELCASAKKSTDTPPDKSVVDAYVMLAEIQLRGVDAETENGDPDQALATMNAAVAYDPSSGFALAQRANLVRRIARNSKQVADVDAIDADFKKALELSPEDPRVLLLAVIEQSLRGSVKTAWDFIDRARALPDVRLEEEYLAPTRFALSLFEAALPVAVLRQSHEQALALTEETLTKLADHHRRVMALPTAIQIYTAQGELDKAQGLFDELKAEYHGKNVSGVIERQMDTLEAMIAQAKGQWHDVVRLLEPYAEASDMPPLARNLFISALSETGQVGRVARLLKNATDSKSLQWIEVQKAAQDLITKRAYADALELVQPFAKGADARLDARVLAVTAQLGLTGAGQPLDALRDELDQMAKLAPERSDVPILRAVVAKRSGDPEAAVEILRTAASKVADPVPVELSLAEFLTQQDRPAALELLNKLQDTYADDYRVWFSTVGFYRGATPPDLEAAKQTVQRALEHITTEPYHAQLELEGLVLQYETTRGDERAQAIEAFKKRAADRPDDIQVRDVLLSLGKLSSDEAQPLINDLKRLQGDGGLLWRFYQARQWLLDSPDEAQRTQAVQLLTYCIDRNPSWEAPALLLGGYYETQGQSDDAERIYRFSTSIRAKNRLYDMLLRGGRTRDAATLIREIGASPAGAQIVPNWQLSLAMRERRYSDALQVLENRAEQSEVEPMVYVQMAELTYLESHDINAALAKLDEADKRGAPPRALAYSRARVLYLDGQSEAAEEVLNKFIESQPSAQAYWLRAAFYEETKQLEKAEADYHTAIGLATDASGYLALGEFYAGEGRLDEAIAIWEKGLTDYPSNELLKMGLFRAMVQRDNPEDAKRIATLEAELEQQNPDSTDLIWSQVVQMVREVGERKIAAARKRLLPLLNKALTSGPASAQVFRGLHTTATRLGQYQLARDLAIRGLQFNPDNATLLVAQATSERDLGSADIARRLTDQVLRSDPENQAAIDLQVDLASQRREPAWRDRLASQAVALADKYPSDAIKAMLAARALAVAGDREQAIKRLTTFCEAQANESCGRVGLMIADLQRLVGNYPAAWEWLEKSAGETENVNEAETVRYELLAAEKHFDELYKRAAESDNPDLMLLAGDLLVNEADDSKRAMQLAELASRSDSEWLPAYVKAATWAQSTGDLTLMIATHRKLHELVPDDADAANNLAWLLASEGQNLEEALSLVEMAVSKQPENFNFRDTQGFVLAKMGRYQQARDAYLRSLQEIPPQNEQQADILAQLAGVCVQINDRATLAPHRDALQRCLAAGGDSLTAEQRQHLEAGLELIGANQE